MDWDGNIVWKFDTNEFIDDQYPGRWMARYHHDFQREGSTTGYYAPGMEPKTDSRQYAVLAHRNARNPKISDKQLLDDVIAEVDWDGDIDGNGTATSISTDGLPEAPKNTLARNPNYRPTQPEGMGDWMHINSMSVLGPNKWYDRATSVSPSRQYHRGRPRSQHHFIISKPPAKSLGLGPDYDNSPEARLSAGSSGSIMRT